MKPKMRLATLMLLGALPLAGIAADYGAANPGGTTSSTTGSSRDQGMSGSAATGTTGSTAQPGAATGDQMASAPRQFRRLDKDKDGMISKDEAKRSKELATSFDQYDTDSDGKLSLTEWQSAHAGGAAGVPGASRGSGSTSGTGTSETPAGSTGGSSGSSSGGGY